MSDNERTVVTIITVDVPDNDAAVVSDGSGDVSHEGPAESSSDRSGSSTCAAKNANDGDDRDAGGPEREETSGRTSSGAGGNALTIVCGLCGAIVKERPTVPSPAMNGTPVTDNRPNEEEVKEESSVSRRHKKDRSRHGKNKGDSRRSDGCGDTNDVNVPPASEGQRNSQSLTVDVDDCRRTRSGRRRVRFVKTARTASKVRDNRRRCKRVRPTTGGRSRRCSHKRRRRS